jgi:hypothetical protein
MILKPVVATWPTIGFVWAIVGTQPIVGLAQVVVTLWTIVGHVQACVVIQPIVGLILVVATLQTIVDHVQAYVPLNLLQVLFKLLCHSTYIGLARVDVSFWAIVGPIRTIVTHF